MTAPTRDQRIGRRVRIYEAARRNARFTEWSHACIVVHPDGPPYAPTTCAGLKASYPLGCLCPCHDIPPIVTAEEAP